MIYSIRHQDICYGFDHKCTANVFADTIQHLNPGTTIYYADRQKGDTHSLVLGSLPVTVYPALLAFHTKEGKVSLPLEVLDSSLNLDGYDPDIIFGEEREVRVYGINILAGVPIYLVVSCDPIIWEKRDYPAFHLALTLDHPFNLKLVNTFKCVDNVLVEVDKQ